MAIAARADYDCPACTLEYIPVCATDGIGFRTFSSQCEMINENNCNGESESPKMLTVCMQS